ncbi:sigma-70 family RNA polymerase sigma factor [Nocardioides sp. BP30]|uniref:sigma-70 family RNA polymerase sigma factor n=1 Tax=Nocardioides sp. BP30 TaxID=3036374 RepID=UPI002468294F|nr:sigma-70 family RNA polymerase sigma factor [Nocardioides sp. BP30]WGL52998.1 sigma-70 family RNA polymerase sigma factor [Nocardioides sp. BP30]
MAGDPEALRALHHAHAAPLWAYVVRLTGDRSRAEDVVQETMLRAWRRGITDVDGGGSARAWLFTVARNLVVDEARSARARHESSSDRLPEASVEDEVDALFESLLVADALRALSQDHRAVVLRAYYGRLTVAEIAAELAIPAGTVKSRLHYGLRALRLALQERGVTR